MPAPPTEAALVPVDGAAVWPVERGERSRAAVWRWRAQAAALLFVLAALLVLVVLPLFWRIPEPRPIRLTGLQGQVSGTYVRGADALFKLVPYADKLPALPGHLPAALAGSAVLVRARQLDEPGAYELRAFQGDKAIPVQVSRRDTHTYSLAPGQALAPGAYYVKAAKDSATKADEYFYFQVR